MIKIMIANWKMNPSTLTDARDLLAKTKKTALTTRNVLTVIAPPTPFLASLAYGSRAKRVLYAAQNIHWEDTGPYVGEASAAQMRDAGAKYILIGHSARRADGESDSDISKKVFAALSLKMTPVVFVGETERDTHGNFLRAIRKQIKAALLKVPQSRVKDVVLVYEPVWAISTSKHAKRITSHEIHQMALFVRKVLVESFGAVVASKVKILYGGSVNPDNAAEILSTPNIEGAVIGAASLSASKFRELLQIANKA